MMILEVLLSLNNKWQSQNPFLKPQVIESMFDTQHTQKWIQSQKTFVLCYLGKQVYEK